MIALVVAVLFSLACSYVSDTHHAGSHLYNNPVSSYPTGSHLYNNPVSSYPTGSHLYNNPASSHGGNHLYNHPVRSYHAGSHLYNNPLSAIHSGSLSGYPTFGHSLYGNPMLGQQFEAFHGWGRMPHHNFAYPHYAHTSDSYGWVQPSLLDSILSASGTGTGPHTHFGPMLGHHLPLMGSHFPLINHLENHSENHSPLNHLQNLLGKFEEPAVPTEETTQ